MLVYTLAALAYLGLCAIQFYPLSRAEYKQRISVTRWRRNGQPLDWKVIE